MHDSSMALMRKFVEDYDLQEATVIDMGSFNVNGTYRDLFVKGKYIGADIVPGRNVDVIVGSDEWDWIKDVDAVISGQTLEHVTDIPGFLTEIYRVLKPGGLLCLIAPSSGPGHDYPTWVGHFPEEKMREVVKAGRFEILSCVTNDIEPWRDTCCIARKALSETTMKKKKGNDRDED